MDGKLIDQSTRFAFSRRDSCGLFDFQEAAVAFCVERLQKGKDAILALDTGLGKTVVLRAILLRLIKSANEPKTNLARVVSPGGLVRQTTESLLNYPWDKNKSSTPRELRVVFAEKTVDYAKIQEHDVMVQNRAIKDAFQYKYVIVDEAHQHHFAGLRHLSCPGLFITASVHDCRRLSEIRFPQPRGIKRRRGDGTLNKDFTEACFVLYKTDRVSQLLGLSRCRLFTIPSTLPTDSTYLHDLVDLVKNNYNFCETTKSYAIMALPKLLNNQSNINALCASALHYVLARVCRSTAFTRDRRSAFALRANVKIFAEKYMDDITSIMGPFSHVNFMQGEISPIDAMATRATDVCPCCLLSANEQSLLYSSHISALPPPQQLWNDDSRGKFWSALIRFPTRSDLLNALASNPPPNDIEVYTLTSEMCAQKRAKTIRSFCSYGGSRAAIVALKRGVSAEGTSPIIKRIASIGGSSRYFINEISSYLARRRILLADSTADVGFNVHQHVDSLIIPRIVKSRTDLQQLNGRLTRIDPSNHKQGSIDVTTRSISGTLDELFARHVMTDHNEIETTLDNESSIAVRNAAHIREMLKDNVQLLDFFNNVLTRAR